MTRFDIRAGLSHPTNFKSDLTDPTDFKIIRSG